MHSAEFGADHTGTVAPLWGRSDEFTHVMQALERGVDVIIEGEKCMGKSTMRNSVASASQQLGYTVCTVQAAMDGTSTGQLLVLDDLDALDGTTIVAFQAWLGRNKAQFVLTRRPARPFFGAEPGLRMAMLDRATSVALRPLTRQQNDELVDGYLATTGKTRTLSSLDRAWVWKASGGFPTLVRALLRDLDLAPTASHDRFSPATIIVASSIIAALPSHLQQTARDLAPLIGVTYPRLLRGFRRAELDLLCEAAVIANDDGVLVMPPPIAMALSLIGNRPRLSVAATEVVMDIATSVEVSAEFSEAEIAVAADALTSSAKLGDQVAVETREAVLSRAMWLARRRGDSSGAAVLARRFTEQFPAHAGTMVRNVARGAPDDFAYLATSIGEITESVGAARVLLAVNCMNLPLTMSDANLERAIEAFIEVAPVDYRQQASALLASLRAAALLEERKWGEAIELAETVAADSQSGPIPLLRALTVLAAACAVNLDGGRLLSVAEHIVDLAHANARVRHVEADLARRQIYDALLFVSLALASAGISQPQRLRVLVDTCTDSALSGSDSAALVRVVLCRLMLAAEERDSREFDGIVRFLRREQSSEHTEWILSFLDSGEIAANPIIEVSSFLRYSVEACLLLTFRAHKGRPELERGLSLLGGQELPLHRIVSAYLQAIKGSTEPAEAPENLVSGSLPAAYGDYVTGIRDKDPDALCRAIEVFLARGLPDDADRSLRALAPMIGDGDGERRIRNAERTIRAQQRIFGAPKTLTDREYQVSRLAGEGLANREIARELFLSVRTVESHLYRAMAKLGVARDEIASALAALNRVA